MNETIPTQEHIDTCVFSRDKLAKNKHEYRHKIYSEILLSGGATCDEIEVALNMKHQTASCFISNLKDDELLYDTGDRRMTRYGRKAIVWKACIPFSQESSGQMVFSK